MDMNKKTVAVIEPNQAMATALKNFLHTHGYAPEVFASAEGFMQRSGGIRVDCLILNMDLGHISGMDFHRKLAEHKTVPPVIFVTGDPRLSVDTRTLADGWIACLRLPLELRALRHALGTAMETSVPQMQQMHQMQSTQPMQPTQPMQQNDSSPELQLSYASRWRARGYVDNLALRLRRLA
jgi:FixJ family two-component response regulator